MSFGIQCVQLSWSKWGDPRGYVCHGAHADLFNVGRQRGAKLRAENISILLLDNCFSNGHIESQPCHIGTMDFALCSDGLSG